MSRWRAHADRVIAAAAAEGRAAGDTPEQLRERIDNAYPFGQRDYLPYKHWLASRRAAFAVLGILSTPERARAAKKAAADQAEIENSPLFLAMRELEQGHGQRPPEPL